MQGQESLILNDGHSMSIVEALTSGPASDLAMAASFTPEGGYGYYSPYISTVLDLGACSSRSARGFPIHSRARHGHRQPRLALTLNTPPSFHESKSVMVAALPAIEAAQPPPPHAVNPKDIYCARQDLLVPPVEVRHCVFSTEYAAAPRCFESTARSSRRCSDLLPACTTNLLCAQWLHHHSAGAASLASQPHQGLLQRCAFLGFPPRSSTSRALPAQ